MVKRTTDTESFKCIRLGSFQNACYSQVPSLTITKYFLT